MTNIEHDNFVGVYDGVVSNDYCDSLINYFEWCLINNKTFGRDERDYIKKDQSLVLNPPSITDINYDQAGLNGFIGEFNDAFWDVCYKDYTEKYSILADYERHNISSYKIQRTDPAGGYHVWHSEDGAVQHSRRIGVYILYLNDIEDGGETEFLYMSKRVKPKTGRLVIFPPNYPWAHRGNPPLTASKYIMTGWVEFS